tara:strand:- start:23 stop:595 length:573 start_codon:yes stop_codon:yes gene_type:complete
MKKLSLYIFLVLIVCNVGFAATLISLNDLKLDENINNYFFNQEISEFSYEGDGYGIGSNYSVLFIPPNKLKDKKYDSLTIAFSNNSKKISYYAGFVEGFKNLNECLNFRDKQVSKSKKEFLIHERENQTNKHSDGLIQQTVRFISIKSSAAFSCDYFEEEKNSRVDFRFDVLTNKFNDWVVNLNDTKTTN